MRQPDDWHLHLRDGEILHAVLVPTARVFGRAIVMPNLSPPITSIQDAINYKKRILKAIPEGSTFNPLMTVYLTEEASPELIKEGAERDVFFAAKLYPANATTNSNFGVADISKINVVLETMEEIGLPLLIHGEVTDPDVDIFDREAVFIERHLDPLLRQFPEMKVVLEHITTEDAVDYVRESKSKLAATITPHHLHINRNAMFEGGLRTDFYCLPVVKRERHRRSLRRAATSGNPRFFLGTDSAPHLRASKVSACGCAGIFNALNAIESYAEVFDQEGALDLLEGFASEFGAVFYGLPLNETFIELEKKSHVVPKQFTINACSRKDDFIVPFHAGESLNWFLTSLH
ncbi:Dihydroorotase [Prochlorococcus sp. MIT 0601]|nr:Dihydroorotase [Prochlorococcus sp. MIT 0601]